MNPIISWALKALVDTKPAPLDNSRVKQAAKLAGLPAAEVDSGAITLGAGPLKSIFSCIQLAKDSDSSEPRDFENEKWLSWQRFDSKVLPSFSSHEAPVAKVAIDKKDEALFETDNEDVALALIRKYGTFLSISQSEPQLSFYDGVRITSAIYACLERNDWKPEFRLLGADLNGIQRYIFDLSESNSKGVAKILRARSFYVGLFMQVARHYLLDEMSLPHYCTIIDAGGRALLIVPDNDKTLEVFQNAKAIIERFCLDRFRGEVALNLSLDVQLTESDFSPELLLTKIEDLNSSLENHKSRLFEDELKGDTWQPESFVFSREYRKYEKKPGEIDENKLCEVCGKAPKESEEKLSEECELQKRIGSLLVKSHYLAFGTSQQSPSGGDIVSFDFKSSHYFVRFIESNLPTDSSYYLIESFQGALNENCVPHFHANYVPTFEYLEIDEQNLCMHPFERYPEFALSLDPNDRANWPKKGDVMDFTTLAHAGASPNDLDESQEGFFGSDLLGVLKADVDRMGQIFSAGIREVFSLTAYSTLSDRLNLFFSAYLPRIQERDFEYVYTVYAGGDDLFFVGEWQQAVRFSRKLYEVFRDYTGQNDNVTLSSAVYIMHPRHPIRLAADNAEDLLKQAKENGRDNIGLFGVLVGQDNLQSLIEDAEFLDERRRLPIERSRVNSSFLHRLLRYSDMAAAFLEEDFIEGLMFAARLAYDVERNLVRRKKNGEIEIGERERQQFLNCTSVMKAEEMRLWRFPISWAIFRNRKLANQGENRT